MWKESSANKGENGLKLFLLPSIPLDLLLPSGSKSNGLPLAPPNHVASAEAQPSPVAHSLHPRIAEALKCAQCYPTEEIIQRNGQNSLHVAVSHCHTPFPRLESNTKILPILETRPRYWFLQQSFLSFSPSVAAARPARLPSSWRISVASSAGRRRTPGSFTAAVWSRLAIAGQRQLSLWFCYSK